MILDQYYGYGNHPKIRALYHQTYGDEAGRALDCIRIGSGGTIEPERIFLARGSVSGFVTVLGWHIGYDSTEATYYAVHNQKTVLHGYDTIDDLYLALLRRIVGN